METVALASGQLKGRSTIRPVIIQAGMPKEHDYQSCVRIHFPVSNNFIQIRTKREVFECLAPELNNVYINGFNDCQVAVPFALDDRINCCLR